MTDKNPDYKAERFNADKLMLELVEADFIEGTAAVLTHGAKKYAPDNWKRGMGEDDVVGSLLRHLYAFRRGEYRDKESGLDHRYHLACNVMFWLHLYPLEGSNKVRNFEDSA